MANPRARQRYPNPTQQDRETIRRSGRTNRRINDAIDAGTVDESKRITRTFGDYRVLPADFVIEVANTAAARNVHLPSAAQRKGRRLLIKDVSGGAGANNVTVRANGAETIDGAATRVINSNYGGVTLRSDGQNWLTE